MLFIVILIVLLGSNTFIKTGSFEFLKLYLREGQDKLLSIYCYSFMIIFMKQLHIL